MLPDFRKRLAESRARRQKMLDNSRANLQEILERSRERRRELFSSTSLFRSKIAYIIYIIFAIKLIHSLAVAIINLFN
jgi:hypothetical protein